MFNIQFRNMASERLCTIWIIANIYFVYDVGVFGVILCIHGTVYELAVYMKELIVWFNGTIYTNN